MRKLTVYNFTTLNGFYKGPNNDINWAKQKPDTELQDFAVENAKGEHILLFGRLTYQMMAGYWPSPIAMQNDPVMSEEMNKTEKIVFSNTLQKAEWNNTRIISGDIVDKVRKLKQTPGKHLTILGSGSIVTLFAENDLIDGYQFMINPVAIGEGTPIFKGITHVIELKLTSSRVFKSGNVLLNYEPVR